MIDLHTHILPGIDDGPRTLEEALEMARIAADDGIELDYSQRNTRCFHNRLTNVFQGISLQPVYGGPVYVFRNALYNVAVEPFKLHNNPSGGLISKGHPLGATGLAQCSELTWQLRGEADKRQVDGAKVALQHNIGLGGAAVVTMYKRADFASA